MQVPEAIPGVPVVVALVIRICFTYGSNFSHLSASRMLTHPSSNPRSDWPLEIALIEIKLLPMGGAWSTRTVYKI